MQHQLAVGVMHRFADLPQHLDPLTKGRALFSAPAVDAFPFDDLHRKIRQTFGGSAAVEKTGDVWMVELGQDLALAPQAFEHVLRFHARAYYLERHPAAEFAVVAVGQKYRAEATPAQLAQNSVGTDVVARRARGPLEKRRLRQLPRLLHPALQTRFGGGFFIGGQQLFQLRSQLGVLRRQLVQERCPLRRQQLGGVVEKFLETLEGGGQLKPRRKASVF